MNTPLHVVVVEDDSDLREWLAAGLVEHGYTVADATDAGQALELIGRGGVDIVVSDIVLGGVSGLELCARLAEERPELPVVLMTAFGNVEAAVGAIRAGARDFVTKPFDLETVAQTVSRVTRRWSGAGAVAASSQPPQRDAWRDDTMLGDSDAMLRLYEQLEWVSESDASVLILGESGTGKEIVARALHRRGRRRGGPFVAINCSAMTESLLESELFGHTRGAFTDAKRARTGLFLQANGGTLLLDEIGDLPVGFQPKILRALEQRTVRPVGLDGELSFDVRVIAASNVDLEAAIAERRFRLDLFYRINVITVRMPPLRERGEDVLLLARTYAAHFAERDGKKIRGITPAAADRLMAYQWPGNVRELRNCVECAVAVARHELIDGDDLPDRVRTARAVRASKERPSGQRELPMAELERQHILRVLASVDGNRAEAARVLGCHRKTVYRKLRRYESSGAGLAADGTKAGSGRSERNGEDAALGSDGGQPEGGESLNQDGRLRLLRGGKER